MNHNDDAKRPGLLRLDNIGIVVASIDDVIPFFLELGMALEGRMVVEGEWSGRVTGVPGQRVEIAMLVTPISCATCADPNIF